MGSELRHSVLKGINGQISIEQIPISVSEYIDYQIQSTPVGAIKGQSLGQEAATNVLIQKAFITRDIDLLKELGYHPPTNEQGEEVGQVGISPGILEILGVELREHQTLLRRVVGVSGELTFNDLPEESEGEIQTQGIKGIETSDDFTFTRNGVSVRIVRKMIPWSMSIAIQRMLQNDPKRAYVTLFNKFTIDGEPITYEMIKDPNGLDIEVGILIFLKLGDYLKKEA